MVSSNSLEGFEKPDEFTDPAFTDDLASSIQTRRLKQIYDRHDDVYNLNARLLAADVRVSDAKKNTLLRQAVEDYISEVRYLMLHEAEEVGEPYWTKYPLGSVQFTCPQSLRDELAEYTIVEQEPRASKQYAFQGLQSLIKAPSVLTMEFVGRVPPSGGGDDGRRADVSSKQVPRHVLLEARDAVNEFLGHIGVDFDVTDDSEGDAGFDYSDLLEDGPPGDGDVPAVADGGGGE